MRRPWPTAGCWAMEKKMYSVSAIFNHTISLQNAICNILPVVKKYTVVVQNVYVISVKFNIAVTVVMKQCMKLNY
jgi:hypothetical protein